MLDTLPLHIKRRLLEAVKATKEKLIEDGGEDLFFYACVEVNCCLRKEFIDYEDGEPFSAWAKDWMDENLITPELRRVVEETDPQYGIDHEEIHSGILAYHPVTHMTNRDDVPKVWAYNARLKMLSEAEELLKCEVEHED